MAYKVLVIDDDVSLLDLLKFQLEKKGFEVLTADKGQKGIELIQENDLDVIVTDLHLPDINGIEMVKRAKEISPATEIIMITGEGSTEKAIEATKAGAFYYIEKPLEFEELLLLIEKARAVEHISSYESGWRRDLKPGQDGAVDLREVGTQFANNRGRGSHAAPLTKLFR